MNKGFIKLHRSLLDWQWYDDHNTTRLLIHLLLSVNWTDKKWKGHIIKAGSMVLSWDTLSKSTGLTVRQCRTAMDKLVNCGEVTRQVTNKWQAVTLVKWGQLQCVDDEYDNQHDKQVTNKWQTDDKQMTTTKEGKEYKEGEERKEIKNKERSKSSSEKKFSDAIHLCYENCLIHFPDNLHPKTESQKNSWLKIIDQLNRIEKAPVELIEQVVQGIRADDFWRPNFQSILKLRRKDKDGVLFFFRFGEVLKEKYDRKNGKSITKEGIEYWANHFAQ